MELKTLTLVWWPLVLGLTAEALNGEFVVGAVSVDHHHAGAVVPLKFESSRAADQVHVARVIYLKAKLFKSRLGVSQVDIELGGKMKNKACQPAGLDGARYQILRTKLR